MGVSHGSGEPKAEMGHLDTWVGPRVSALDETIVSLQLSFLWEPGLYI